MSEVFDAIYDTDVLGHFYEPLSGRYFRSTEAEVLSAIDCLNDYNGGNRSFTINDWYNLLGLPSIQLGDYTCFDIDAKTKLGYDALYDFGVRLSDEHYDNRIRCNVKDLIYGYDVTILE